MYASDLDHRVRLAAFDWLAQERVRWKDEVLPYHVLARGFEFEGTRVPLVGPEGIFKPAVLPEMPLSITTKAPRRGEAPPYEDRAGEGGLVHYSYRGTDPAHPSNRRLRLAYQRGVPLVYVFGVREGHYLPVWPVRLVADDPAHLTFTVDLGGASLQAAEPAPAAVEPVRRYATVTTLQRIHQAAFRSNVLEAYGCACAICRLKHAELLDASHIVPDGLPRGEPVTPNGLTLCKIHHAAFDANILGIRPDYVVEVRPDVLEEEDGPMLRFGLQSAHESPLVLPRSRADRPDPSRLEWRWERFRKAS